MVVEQHGHDDRDDSDEAMDCSVHVVRVRVPCRFRCRPADTEIRSRPFPYWDDYWAHSGGIEVTEIRTMEAATAEIRNVEPLYPAEALEAGLEGEVMLQVVIGTAGFVTDARVLRSAPHFDGAAIAAVKQWRYVPTVVGGTPVPVTFTVTVRFRPR